MSATSGRKMAIYLLHNTKPDSIVKDKLYFVVSMTCRTCFARHEKEFALAGIRVRMEVPESEIVEYEMAMD